MGVMLLALLLLQDPDYKALVEGLIDKNRAKQAKARQALEDAGEPAVRALLDYGLKSRDKALKAAAKDFMPHLAAVVYVPPHLEKAAERIFKTPMPRYQRNAEIKHLIDEAGPGAWRFCEVMLEDRDPIARAAAIEGLMPAPSSLLGVTRPVFAKHDYLPHLIAGMRNTEASELDPETLEAVGTFARSIWTLAEPGDLAAMQPVLEHANPRVRRALAKALPNYAHPADEVWEKLAADVDLDVRRDALAAAGSVTFAVLPDAVTKMLESSSADQRFAAAVQVARHGDAGPLAGFLRGEFAPMARAALMELPDAVLAAQAEAIRGDDDLPLLRRIGARDQARKLIPGRKFLGSIPSDLADWVVGDVADVIDVEGIEWVLASCETQRDRVRAETVALLASEPAPAWATLRRQAERWGVDPSLEAPALEALKDPSGAGFEAAADLAGRGGFVSAREPLRSAIDNRAAASALARLGTAEDRLSVIQRHPSLAGLVAAGATSDDAALLRRAYADSKKPEFGIALARVGTTEDAPAMRALLESDSVAIHSAALAGLVRIGDRSSFARVSVMFRDEKKPRFHSMIEEVAALDPRRSPEVVEPMLRDAEPTRRVAAAMALARIGHVEALPAIRRMARTEPWAFDRRGNTALDAYMLLAEEEARRLVEELDERGALPDSARRYLRQ